MSVQVMNSVGMYSENIMNNVGICNDNVAMNYVGMNNDLYE